MNLWKPKEELLNIDAILKAFKNPNLAILISLFFILTFSFANIYGTFALLGLQVYGFTDLQNGYMFGIIGLSSAISAGRIDWTDYQTYSGRSGYFISVHLL